MRRVVATVCLPPMQVLRSSGRLRALLPVDCPQQRQMLFDLITLACRLNDSDNRNLPAVRARLVMICSIEYTMLNHAFAACLLRFSRSRGDFAFRIHIVRSRLSCARTAGPLIGVIKTHYLCATGQVGLLVGTRYKSRTFGRANAVVGDQR